jgi:Asp-tRNA(Asn)/Glu-tRNA(Gln) amidotransferase A subunit family amidase
MTRCRRVAP